MNVNFLVRGKNCEKYLRDCLFSLSSQTCSNWTAFLSIDKNGMVLQDIIEHYLKKYGISENVTYRLNSTREHWGPARNMYEGLMAMKDVEGVSGILDADDYLAPDAVMRVLTKYTGDCYVTYGSYVKESKGRKTRISAPYEPGAMVRCSPWHASHLKTFRVELVKHLTADMFQDEKGKWLTSASDLALMFPIMELAGLDRCRHISKPIYHWRDNTPYKCDAKDQRRCEKIVRGKHKLKRLDEL
jgi:hypothetical protein